jgi:hypothetical protein
MKNIFCLYLICHFSILINSPTAVTDGGTGLPSITAYAVLCAGTTPTSTMQFLSSVGTSGQALVSGGSASLPAFGTIAISGGGTGATTLSAGVIQSNGSVLSSLGIGSAEQVLKNTSGTVNWSSTGLLQLVSTSTSARISTTGTSIPNDDTIPQNTEGTEILTLSITPESSSSNLLIFFSTSGTPTTTTPAFAALFVDSTSDALAAQYICYRSSGNSFSGVLSFIVSSASTSARTYKIRIGGGNFQINSGSGSRKFGGTASTYLIIAEIA